MEIEPMEKHVESLIEKAANAPSADEAMKLAQAALNAANAMCSLVTAENLKVKG
jgi:hypothetical protein